MATVREARDVFSTLHDKASLIESRLNKQERATRIGMNRRVDKIVQAVFNATRYANPASHTFGDPAFTQVSQKAWNELLRQQGALQESIDAFEKKQAPESHRQWIQAQAYEKTLLDQEKSLRQEVENETVLAWAKRAKVKPQERQAMESAGWLGALLVVEKRDARQKMKAVQQWEMESGRDFWSAFVSAQERVEDLSALYKERAKASSIVKEWSDKFTQHDELKRKVLLPQQAKDQWAQAMSEQAAQLPLRAFEKVADTVVPSKAEALKETLAVARTLSQVREATEAYRKAAHKIAEDLDTPLRKLRRASTSNRIKLDLDKIKQQVGTALDQLKNQQAAAEVSIPHLMDLETQGSRAERAAMIHRSYSSSSETDAFPVWLWVWMGLQNHQHCMALGHPTLTESFSAQNLDASSLATAVLASSALDTSSLTSGLQLGAGSTDAALFGLGAGLGAASGFDALGGLSTGDSLAFSMPDISTPAFSVPDFPSNFDTGSSSGSSDWSSSFSSSSDFSSSFDSSSSSSSFDSSSSSSFDSGSSGW